MRAEARKLRSMTNPSQVYTGSTSNLSARIVEHNEGGTPHTAKFKPWKRVVSIDFPDDNKAHAFERYLKTGV